MSAYGTWRTFRPTLSMPANDPKRNCSFPNRLEQFGEIAIVIVLAAALTEVPPARQSIRLENDFVSLEDA